MPDLATIFSPANLGDLLMLCFLQAVLGFDNLLYISIESQRAPVAQQQAVRQIGIVVAVALRIVLLVVVLALLSALEAPFHVFDLPGILTGGVNFATVVFVLGGIFIIYTAVKEIAHLLAVEHLDEDVEGKPGRSAVQVVALIVLVNLVFSFDSVLSAIAITDVFWVLATAIVLSGAAMLALAERVTRFIERNRMFEVLGLFILLIVGVVLLGEAGVAAAHATGDEGLAIHVFGYPLVPMSKTTFYFSVIVLFVVEIIQSGYARKLDGQRRTQSRIRG